MALHHLLRQGFSWLAVGLKGLVMMSVVTGCADRPYDRYTRGGESSDLLILPFIVLNEVALLIPENEQRKAVAAQKAEELSKDRRFEELKELVSKGGAGEQYELANCYFDGQSAVRDLPKAFNLYRLAAGQGHVESQNKLGICYHNGHGVRKDQVEACAWWSLVGTTNLQAQASLAFVRADELKRMTPAEGHLFTLAVAQRMDELRQEIRLRALSNGPRR
jgi:TPR repeat protein